jgi:anti-anti-sigma factor
MSDIQERSQEGISIFTLGGRVDTEGAVNLDIQLHAALAEGKHKMVLDMSELRYINSAGLRTLADVLTQNKENGGDLKLVGLNPKIRRVFEIVGFNHFFSSYETVEAALKAF